MCGFEESLYNLLGKLYLAITTFLLFRTGNLRKEYLPYLIFFKNDDGVNSPIKFVTCGETFTAAIDKDQNLFMFGDNYHG
jgi:alpha-tubulin suppressor-like RCC1 family protein